MGLLCPRPGIEVFHFTFCDFGTSQLVGTGQPSKIPLALGPRNDGQLISVAGRAAFGNAADAAVGRMDSNPQQTTGISRINIEWSPSIGDGLPGVRPKRGLEGR